MRTYAKLVYIVRCIYRFRSKYRYHSFKRNATCSTSNASLDCRGGRFTSVTDMKYYVDGS